MAPLKPLGDDGLHLLELFHGPTLAFKDVALQLLGPLFDHALTPAASTPPSSARPRAIPARPRSRPCATAQTIDIFMLHPRGRVSEVQRRQMTTVLAPNVHNIAIEGTFDDCQDLVKALFNDLAFRDRLRSRR